MSNFSIPRRILMLDNETLSTLRRAVVIQIGGIFADLADLDSELFVIDIKLPAQPQLEMIPPRDISMSTITFWFQNQPAAKTLFADLDGDLDELDSFLRMFVRNFKGQMAEVGDDYEVWCRGTDFDISVLGSLLTERGIEVPWRYDKVRDLRTVMSLAGLHKADVSKPEGYVEHDAVWDSRYQIKQLAAALAKIRPA